MLRIRTVLTGTTGGPFLSTMYFGGADDQTAANNANAAVGAFWGSVDNFLGNSLSWSTAAEVVKMSTSGVVSATFAVTPISGAGGATGVYMAPASQGLVRWRTGSYIGGREVRGRTFIPAVTQANSTSAGGPGTTFVTGVNTAAATLISDPNSELIVWSKRWSSTATALTGSMWGSYAVLRSRRD